MAVYSRVQLRNAVLQELGVIDGQGAPSNEDATLADDRCQQQLEYLYDQGLINFNLDGNTIPSRYFFPLVQYIADAIKIPYGVGARGPMLMQGRLDGEKALRKLKAQPYLGQSQRTQYF